MTAPQFDAEREVDLARWRRAVVALWWLPVAGLVLGAIVGVLYSFRGGTNYKATALISLGQPTSPGGALVPSYGTNPRAVSQIVSGAKFQEEAANAADMRPAALRGHVSVGTIGSAGAGAARTQPLISLTVTGAHGKNVAAAANKLADIVVAADDGVVRAGEDQDLRNDAREREAAAQQHHRRPQRLHSGARRGAGEEARPAAAARDRRPGEQRRDAAGQPDRAGGDAAAAARLRDAGREREGGRACGGGQGVRAHEVDVARRSAR